MTADTTPTDRDETPLAPLASRRAVLLGAGALGAAGLLAACGTDSPAAPSGGAPGNAPAGASSTVKAADIPVGGGKIFGSEQVVVTQPTAGEFKAFSAICTHMGCVVDTVQDGKIGCSCHLSQFNITDGSVARGPATKALPSKRVTASGDNLTVA